MELWAADQHRQGFRPFPPNTPGTESAPEPAVAADKAPEDFLSYVWGDETPEGKVLTQVGAQLQAALEKAGF